MWCIGAAMMAEQEQQLSDEDRRRRDCCTPCIAIRRYSKSPFLYLFESGDNQALLNCCGVDHPTFNELLLAFEPVFNCHTFDQVTGRIRTIVITKKGFIKGRKREMDAVGCLGLVMYWFRTRGSLARCGSLAFGSTSTPMYRWLKFSRRVLLFVLLHHPLAKISDPSSSEIREYYTAIGTKYSYLMDHRVWGACDGLKLLIQKPSNHLLQSRFYNGWTSDCYVNSVFVFAPDGRIRIATINAPGSWHDSTLADYGVYDKMEDLYREHLCKVVVDFAFNLQGRNFLIKSSQTNPTDPYALALNNDAIKL